MRHFRVKFTKIAQSESFSLQKKPLSKYGTVLQQSNRNYIVIVKYHLPWIVLSFDNLLVLKNQAYATTASQRACCLRDLICVYVR